MILRRSSTSDQQRFCFSLLVNEIWLLVTWIFVKLIRSIAFPSTVEVDHLYSASLIEGSCYITHLNTSICFVFSCLDSGFH